MKLTVTMATHDDYDGVYFTVQSLRLHHKLPAGTEILILDNNPDSNHGKALASFAGSIPNLRVVDVRDRMSSFVKYDALHLAAGEVILGLDCHVLLQPGFLEALGKYWDEHPDSKDMLTGPLLYNDLKHTSVKMLPVWRGHDYGIWGDDVEAMIKGLPFEVPMMGMGCWCLKKSTAPTLAKGFTGFGAEEWYFAEKVRQNGGRVMCHPAMGWNHRFDWPVRNFPLRLHDKIKNYYRGWIDLYQDPTHPMLVEMSQYWIDQGIGREVLAQLIREV